MTKGSKGPDTSASVEPEVAEQRPGDLGIDPQRLYEAIEATILGSDRTLTRVEVAEQADVPMDRAIELWRGLGFPAVGDDDDVRFVDADIEALRMVDWLVSTGFIEPKAELALTRSMGRSFARLAEWEISELAAAAITGSMMTDQDRLEDLVARLVPVVEDLQNYVWRRHIANAAGRILLLPGEDGEKLAVGFADIVGFTRRSRGMDSNELSELIETFEGTSASLVTEHQGRMIKTIGDEVLFVADDPINAARIGIGLVEASAEDERFPDVRVGLAYGEVVHRLGDVYGPVVNIASRLTSLARPGRILVDRDLHTELKPVGEFRVKRSRTAAVRGYTRLETWTLRRPRESR